nr:MAG TPA: hypothetical protein [Caudoviricetes sp.]
MNLEKRYKQGGDNMAGQRLPILVKSKRIL